MLKKTKKYLLVNDVEYKLNTVYRRDDSGKLCLTITFRPKFKLFPRFYYINNSRTSILTVNKNAGVGLKHAVGLKEAKVLVVKELIKA